MWFTAREPHFFVEKRDLFFRKSFNIQRRFVERSVSHMVSTGFQLVLSTFYFFQHVADTR